MTNHRWWGEFRPALPAMTVSPASSNHQLPASSATGKFLGVALAIVLIAGVVALALPR